MHKFKQWLRRLSPLQAGIFYVTVAITVYWAIFRGLMAERTWFIDYVFVHLLSLLGIWILAAFFLWLTGIRNTPPASTGEQTGTAEKPAAIKTQKKRRAKKTPQKDSINQSWFKKATACSGAFLYHRLHEDLAFLDVEGGLISRGDCSLEYPPGVK